MSVGTCGRSSLFLQSVLVRDLSFDARWVIGVPDADCDAKLGLFAHDRWQAHAWVEVADRTLIDITADQFGCAPVIVAPLPHAHYRKGRNDPAWPQARTARKAAADALWPLWEASRERAKLLARQAAMGRCKDGSALSSRHSLVAATGRSKITSR